MGFVVKLLLVIGALNWGLVGIGGFMGQDLNVVHLALGSIPALEWIIYLLVGVAGVWKIFTWKD